MEKLKFYDLKKKKSFVSADWKKMSKSGKNFAIATAPSGARCCRIIGKKK